MKKAVKLDQPKLSYFLNVLIKQAFKRAIKEGRDIETTLESILFCTTRDDMIQAYNDAFPTEKPGLVVTTLGENNGEFVH